MGYKTETHMHTSDTSNCGQIKARDMVKLYHDEGFKTLFVTDHYNPNFFERLGNIPWQQKTAIFLAGYYRAKEISKEYSMNIILAAEFQFGESKNHYLAYGIDKDFLDRYPEAYKLNIEQFYKIAKDNGIFLIQAHPYRDGKNTPTPEFVEGFEVCNGNPRHENFEKDSIKLAKKYAKLMTAGSDSHRPEDIAMCGIETEKEIKCTEDYISALKNYQAKIYKK